eukprot:scaffold70346_cov37-Prasinocladus_malaysianus.AAC.1
MLVATCTRSPAGLKTSPTTAPLQSRRLWVSASASRGGAAGGEPGKRKKSGRSKRNKGRARLPGQYEVKVITPPPKNLGVHSLEPNMGCGDEFEVEGSEYVVSSVVLRYRLEYGKYVRDHNRLEVQPTSRYFLNRMLDDIYEQSPQQDDEYRER